MLACLALAASALNAAVAATQPDAETDPDRKIPEFKLESPTPLDSAIETLRNATHANIVVDWPSLQDAGVKREAPVRIHLWNVTLNQALRAIIAVADYHGLISFEMQDGMIVVAAREKLWRAGRVVRVYDVRPVVEDLLEYRRLHTPATQADHSGAALSADEATNAIVRLIQTTAVSDGSQRTGTDTDFIRPFAGRLIISQTPENHQKIASLLRALRERGTTEGTALFGQ
jgi:hypothetical protein